MMTNAELVATLQAENALLRQRVADLEQHTTYLRQLFARLTDVVMVLDSAGCCCDILSADTSLLYRPTAEVIGKTLHEVLPRSQADAFLTLIQEALTTGQPVSVEYPLTVLAGEHWFAGHVSPLDANTVLFTTHNITERKQAESALQRRDAILEAVNRIAEELLTASNWRTRITDVLTFLGSATNASRVYIFQNYAAPDGTLLTSQCCEWTAPGVSPQIDNPMTHGLSLRNAGFTDWEELLSSNRIIAGHVTQFPPSVATFLAEQDIASLVIVPIFAGQVWWGFIGFDACYTEREWTPLEIDALRVAANILGATILRRQAENAFHSIFENAPIGIFRITLDGQFLVVNPATAQLLGYSSAQELIQSVPHVNRLYVAPARRPEIVQMLLEREGSAQIENSFYHRDGHEIIGQLNVWIVRNDAGVPLYLEGFIKDITEQKRLEAEQRLNEDRLESLYRLSQMRIRSDEEIIGYALEEGVRLTNSQVGYLHFVNDDQISLNLFTWSKNTEKQCTATRVAHYPLEQAGVWVDCVHQRRPVIHNDYQDLPHKQGYPPGHIHLIRHMNIPVFDGDRIVAVAGVGNKEALYNDADVRQLHLFMNDMWVILERKRAEERLRISEELYRSLISASPDGIIGTDLQGNITFNSPVAMRMFGLERYEDVIGRNILEFVVPEDHACAVANVQQMLDGTPTGVGAYRAMKSDGTLFDLEVNGEIVHDAAGHSTGMVYISRDVTERKRIERDLAVKTADLEQALQRSYALAAAADTANRAKSVFLANMSHELRTPLNAILGFTQLMFHNANLTAEQQENLQIMLRSGEHLLDLINDVLDLSKIEAGRTVVQEQDFDLTRMLADLEEMFQLRADEKGLALLVERQAQVPRFIRTDTGKLRQVLINLFSNALKFTATGRITLRVGVSLEHAATEQWQERQLLFEMVDTGIGIPPDELATVFDPFVQAETDDKTKEGTGLGLSISQQFVRLMGGELTASSTPGQGSTFRFTLPFKLADAVVQPVEQPRRQVVGLAPGQLVYRLLVVEDQAVSRKLLVKLLTTLGFDVREAENGQAAVEAWAAWEPHLIWMDMRMPVMDGYTATRRIKATLQGQSTVIIALTASAFETERAMILAQGCDDFLRKPFRQTEIIDTLVRFLGVRFEYATTAPPVTDHPATGSGSELPGPILATMDHAWLDALRQATISADLDRMLVLIDDLRPAHGLLAQTLADLAHNFEHDMILQFIAQAGSLATQ
jgi:two-component system sensor histidine kinase/response regulator